MNDKLLSNDGKLTDVLVEDCILTSMFGQSRIATDIFIVWADANLKDLIKSVDGVVTTKLVSSDCETCYAVSIDHRYDMEEVKKEVTAAILCRDETIVNKMSKYDKLFSHYRNNSNIGFELE